jgi:hypothetical protein
MLRGLGCRQSRCCLGSRVYTDTRPAYYCRGYVIAEDSGFQFLNQLPVSVMAAKNITAPKQGNAGS